MAKVVLTAKTRPTYTVTLPKSGAGVTMYKEMSSGDILDMPENVTNVQRGIYLLEKAIQEWEFVSEDGETPMPISAETFRIIDPADLKFMLKEVQDNYMEDTKTSLTKEKKSQSSNTTQDGSDGKSEK